MNDSTLTDFQDAYQCLIDYTDNTLFNAAGGTKDESMREAWANRCFKEDGSPMWPPPPSDDDIRRSVEYAIDYEVRYISLYDSEHTIGSALAHFYTLPTSCIFLF